MGWFTADPNLEGALEPGQQQAAQQQALMQMTAALLSGGYGRKPSLGEALSKAYLGANTDYQQNLAGMDQKGIQDIKLKMLMDESQRRQGEFNMQQDLFNRKKQDADALKSILTTPQTTTSANPQYDPFSETPVEPEITQTGTLGDRIKDQYKDNPLMSVLLPVATQSTENIKDIIPLLSTLSKKKDRYDVTKGDDGTVIAYNKENPMENYVINQGSGSSAVTTPLKQFETIYGIDPSKRGTPEYQAAYLKYLREQKQAVTVNNSGAGKHSVPKTVKDGAGQVWQWNADTEAYDIPVGGAKVDRRAAVEAALGLSSPATGGGAPAVGADPLNLFSKR